MAILSQSFKIFLSQVNQFMSESKGNVWFRGHSNIGENGEHYNYALNSTLFRIPKGLKDIQRLEKNYIYEFMTKGYSLHQTQNEWELLYIMQHYGSPTRLLDWTSSLSIALYFATLNWDPAKNKPSIWMLNPSKLNETMRGRDDLILPRGDFDKYVKVENLSSHAIAPFYNSERLIAQQGQFTLQGNFNKDLAQELASTISSYSDILTEIELDAKLFDDVISYLHMNGINDFTVFPDLNGLSKLVSKRKEL